MLKSLATAALIALPLSSLTAQDMAAICREHRAYRNGEWASYVGTGGPNHDTTRMRNAIVGVEGSGTDARYWYEITTSSSGRRRDGTAIIQMLISGMGQLTPRVHGMVVKSGSQPAQRMPDQMIQMMSGRMGESIASEMAKQCERSQVIGTESITVPAGTFRALHIRGERTDSWWSREIPFYMIRIRMENGTNMELTGYGRDAKSSITETPQVMGGNRRP